MGGLGMIYTAWSVPSKYNLSAASAIQATQVYAEAQTDALIGIGLLVTCAVFAFSGARVQIDDLDRLVETMRDQMRAPVKEAPPGVPIVAQPQINLPDIATTLKTASEHMQAKRYGEARVLLQTIPENMKAQELLKQLDDPNLPE